MAKQRKEYREAERNVVEVFLNVSQHLSDCLDSARIKYDLTDEEMRNLHDESYISVIALMFTEFKELPLEKKPDIKKACTGWIKTPTGAELTTVDWKRIEGVLRRQIWQHKGEVEYNREQDNKNGEEYHMLQVERLQALLEKISPLGK